jgi:putative addiction module component (TIGR02574 family)
MDETHDRILREAMKLPPEARAALAGSLIDSLEEPPDPDAESEWQREIARRMRELDAGEVDLISWSEARRAIHGAV